MDRPKLDIPNLISNVDLFMYLIKGIRFGTWKDRGLNWALLTFSCSPKDFNYIHHCKIYCLVLFVGQYSISQTLSFGRCVISQFWNRLYTYKVLFSLRNCQAVLVNWAWIQVACESVHPFGSLYVSGKLPTYPSPKPTLTLISQLRQNIGLGEG